MDQRTRTAWHVFPESCYPTVIIVCQWYVNTQMGTSNDAWNGMLSGSTGTENIQLFELLLVFGQSHK